MKLVAKLFAGLLVACAVVGAAEKPPFAHAPMGVANGCFVESVAMLDAWQETMGAEAWAKMLRWGTVASVLRAGWLSAALRRRILMLPFKLYARRPSPRKPRSTSIKLSLTK